MGYESREHKIVRYTSTYRYPICLPIRVWNGAAGAVDLTPLVLIQSSSGGFGLDWTSNRYGVAAISAAYEYIPYAAVSTCHVSQSQYTLSHTRGRTQNGRIQPLADPGGGGQLGPRFPKDPVSCFPPPPPKKRSISVNFLARARSGV